MAAATIESFVDEIATKANIHPEAAATAVGTILFVAKGGQHHQAGSTFSTIARRNTQGSLAGIAVCASPGSPRAKSY
jgi:hypothetical protein